MRRLTLRHSRTVLLLSGLILSVALVLPSSASAQDGARRAVFGPGSDFFVRGFYGGDVPAAEIGTGCVGWVTALPNLIIEVDSGAWVHFTVDIPDNNDTTLLLRSQEDEALCNDNADPTTVDPEIVSYLTPGEYYVYVGAKEASLQGTFRLRVTEARAEHFPIISSDRVVLHGVSGGTHDAADRAEGCVGAIPGRPNHVVRLRNPDRLYITAEATSDLTLIIVDEDGALYCNDDAHNTLNPRIAQEFPSGLVRIYVGSHNPKVSAHYRLIIEPTAG